MISFAAPGFLLAGALLAAVPLALHMLARTPPERRPLPTARFLTVDRRTRLRLRRPTDLVLLALRMAFLVLLGAAFARPEWLPERTGGAVVVLLDAGPEMAPVWEEAIAVARDRAGRDGAVVVFDSTARVAADPEAALDSLAETGPGTEPASYLAALRGLKAAAGTLPAESARAVLVTRPRWGAWSPAVAAARGAAWPARIEVVAMEGRPLGLPSGEDARDREAPEVEPGAEGATDSTDASPVALIGVDQHPLRPYATAALRALGYARSPDTAAGLVVVLPSMDPTTAPTIPQAPRVVLLGGPLGKRGARPEPAPWTISDQAPHAGSRSRGRLVLPGGRSMEGWMPRAGKVADGSVVAAVWEDGRPAAAASRGVDSCLAYLAADPVEPAAAADPAFPWLLRTLARACTPPATLDASGESALLDEVPLDRGALTVLRGDALPAAVDLLAAEGPRHRPLAWLLAALALLVALIEAGLAYSQRQVR